MNTATKVFRRLQRNSKEALKDGGKPKFAPPTNVSAPPEREKVVVVVLGQLHSMTGTRYGNRGKQFGCFGNN
jgi:hypothetical protein